MHILERPAQLGIFLRPAPDRELRIGTLSRAPDGAVDFFVDDAYVAIGASRPILSLSWAGATEELSVARLSQRGDKTMRGSLLPPFFQNLLPEGALRDLVERTFGSDQFDQFDVLARLGEDLPGAVVAKREAGRFAETVVALPEFDETATTPIHFSLSGVQLKFSMTRRGALTVPAQHGEGEIILKTPSPHYAFVPECEFTALALAEVVGIRVAKTWLVNATDVQGIPEHYLHGGKSLAVRRFDRAPGGRRVHIEDFAQIYGAIGDAKYAMGNDATIMNTVKGFASDGRGEMLESVRRVVVNILLGNGDAHLKNWSFIFPEPGVVALSPAYDLVPTFLYGDDTMAMKLGGTNNPFIIGTNRFERAAGLMHVDPKIVVKEVRATIKRAIREWPNILAASPMPRRFQEQIVERLPRLQIVQEHFPDAELTLAAEPDPEPEGGLATLKL